MRLQTQTTFLYRSDALLQYLRTVHKVFRSLEENVSGYARMRRHYYASTLDDQRPCRWRDRTRITFGTAASRHEIGGAEALDHNARSNSSTS